MSRLIVFTDFFCSTWSSADGGHMCVNDWLHHCVGDHSTVSACSSSCSSVMLANGLQEETQDNRSSSPSARISQSTFHNTRACSRAITRLPLLMWLYKQVKPKTQNMMCKIVKLYLILSGDSLVSNISLNSTS